MDGFCQKVKKIGPIWSFQFTKCLCGTRSPFPGAVFYAQIRRAQEAELGRPVPETPQTTAAPKGARPPAEFWPGLSLVAPLAGGARNVVWHARDGAGRDWVLKSTGHAEAALAWLEPVHAAARAAGLRVPEAARAPDGRRAPGGWCAEPFLVGRTGTPADLACLAPRLAAFHAAVRDLPARPGLPGTAEAPLPADLRPDLAAALAAALAPMAGAAAGAIHGDLNPGNLIVTPEGPALIDWDEARRDWHFLDQIATRPASDPEARAALAVEILSCRGPEPARAAELTQRLLGPAPLQASPADRRRQD